MSPLAPLVASEKRGLLLAETAAADEPILVIGATCEEGTNARATQDVLATRASPESFMIDCISEGSKERYSFGLGQSVPALLSLLCLLCGWMLADTGDTPANDG